MADLLLGIEAAHAGCARFADTSASASLIRPAVDFATHGFASP